MFKILLFTLFFTIFLHANVITLDSNMHGLKTFSQVSVYEDTTKKMGIEDIKAQDFKINHAITHSNQGASKSNWWIKFEVQNPKNEPIDWILNFNYGQFDEMQSWQYNDKNILISNFLKGDHYVDESKISFNQRSSFEFITPAKEKNTIYVKLAYVDAGLIEMFHSIWTKSEFAKSQELRFNLLVGIISALFVLLFYNVFIWFILRKKEYFWYSTYIIGVILSISTFNQLGAHYLWSNSLYLIDMMPFVGVGTLIISFVLFTREFLETYKHLPKVDKALKIFIIVNIVAFVLANLGARHFAISIMHISAFSFIFFPIIGFILWHRGYKIARGYAISSLFLSTFIMISLLRYAEILASSELLFWMSRFGFIAEGILLSIALADRISILEHDTKNAQDEVRHTLEKVKETLESEVIKRTLELEKQTKKAEELARTDEMTGIANRRAFLEQGKSFIQQSIRYKTAFTLVIIDIDHFKNINDNYGHEAGDLVLISLTKAINDNIRDTDFFARIGGEEFVLLLPHTTSDLAVEKTKKLLKKINELEVSYKDTVLKITVSMGICEFTQHDDTIYSLLSKADQSLYYVKEHGRNNVHVHLASN
ncbi:MAG: diguanylate cyclase [Sulfurimonas sp.]|jgi:diguanylate cyclase (GGDEF)-like protein